MKLAVMALAAGVAAQAVTSHRTLVSREAYLMGTRATLSTFDAQRAAGLERVDRMLRLIEDTEAQLSTWRDTSEVSRLNARAGGGARTVSPSLCAALDRADRWARETSGAFDPATGALVAAWDLHGRGRIPTDAELAAARSRSGWTRVAFDRSRCTIDLPAGVTLDVGAWGKGEGLDRARAAGGEAPWLVDLGGQVAVQGAPPDADGWTVAIAHPFQRDVPLLEIGLSRGSLATSAGSERDLEVSGRRVGHILDPGTGRPARFSGSVTVWHAEAFAADALSTALFVMGPEKGIAWAEARGIAALYLIPRDGEVSRQMTRAFTERFMRTIPGSPASRDARARRGGGRCAGSSSSAP